MLDSLPDLMAVLTTPTRGVLSGTRFVAEVTLPDPLPPLPANLEKDLIP